jgi:hypothetical protein
LKRKETIEKFEKFFFKKKKKNRFEMESFRWEEGVRAGEWPVHLQTLLLLFTHGLSALYLPRLYVDGITMQTANQALWDGWGCLGKEKQNKYRKAGKAQNLNK